MRHLQALCTVAALVAVPCAAQLQQQFGLSGHLGTTLNSNNPEPGYQHGISFYTSLFTLTPDPSQQLQLGAGTWFVPDNRTFQQPLCPPGTYARDNWPERGPTYRDVYQTLEGGVGTWVSTRFPTSAPKFRVNAVPDCYSHQLGVSGFAFHGDALPHAKRGFAQLANRLLMPPDGTVFEGANVASLFGFGWFALPLIPAYTSPAGVPTGDQSWTLFMHAANFRGPVGFFPPETWSAVNTLDKTGVGRGHDRMGGMSGGAALEIGEAAMFTATASNGVRYRRIARMTFPVDSSRRAVLVQDFRFYGKSAIWDRIGAWANGGAPVREFAAAGTFRPPMQGDQVGVHFPDGPVEVDPTLFTAGAVALGDGRSAFALRWGNGIEPGVVPEYYRESGGVWRAIPASQVPAETQLAQQSFIPKPVGAPAQLDIGVASPWSAARWSAGPFTVRLRDGSNVDYVWYRMREQPALQDLGLSAATLDRLQLFAESLHQEAGVAGVSFAAPTSGTLATLDPAQIVTPPPGLEKGYVPIAIRQYSAGISPKRDYSDLWWNPAESGWGLSFTQHATNNFAAWYIYDASGRATWIVMPGGEWTTPNTFTGALYTASGPDPLGAFDPAQVTATPVGTGTFTFSAYDRAVLAYQVGNVSATKELQRQLFGPAAQSATSTPNYGDMWWNPSESGWGVSITQQNRTLFAVWYAYDANRQPIWYVLPSGSWITGDTWSGTLYRTTVPPGPFLGGAFDPATVQASPVGTLAFRFTGPAAAVMTYTVNGVPGTKNITRQAF